MDWALCNVIIGLYSNCLIYTRSIKVHETQNQDVNESNRLNRNKMYLSLFPSSPTSLKDIFGSFYHSQSNTHM